MTQLHCEHVTNCHLIVNHSCEPNVVFDLSADDMFDWHVQAMTSIEVGTVRKYFLGERFLLLY